MWRGEMPRRAETRQTEEMKDYLTAEYKEFIGCVLQRDRDIIQAIPEAERDVVILEEPVSAIGIAHLSSRSVLL